MAFIFSEEKEKAHAGSGQMMRPNSFNKLSIRSSPSSTQPLMNIPETGVTFEPPSLKLKLEHKKEKVQLLQVRDCSCETNEDDSSREYKNVDIGDRAPWQYKTSGRGARSHSISRTITSEQHERFLKGSGISNTDNMKEGKKRRLNRSASSTVIKSPVDENGKAIPFQKPLRRQRYCEKFLGSWHTEMGGQERRILSTGEVLGSQGQRKYVVKFLSPLKFRIPQDSGRPIIASLKQDGLYLQLETGEIWVKKGCQGSPG